MAGFFVAFEGGEGAGKSTQVRLLAEALAGRGLEVVTTREPGGTPAGAALRAVLLDPATELSPRAEALLYAADRAHHVATVIRPALVRGAVVISDRYVDSSLAYQGAGRTLVRSEVGNLSSWASEGLVPDFTVLLDLDPEVGLARAGDPDRLEAEPLDFHRRVRAGFLELARAEPHRYVVVDAEQPPDAVFEDVWAAVHAAVTATR
jgi:dTMP kinase